MMITRCPECATAFRVTEEQISARQGRVRCGHCATIFDALAGLESPREELLPVPPHDVPLRDAEEPAPVEQLEVEEAPPFEPREAEAPPLEPRDAAEPEASEDAHEQPSEAEAAPARVPEIEIRDAVPAQRAPDRFADDEESTVPFGRKRRFSPWWTAAAALLLVALNLQALFYFRGTIALVWPGSKPYIERLCAQLRCEVPLPRRAELMSIETSELQADPGNPGVMLLSATLRNRAAFPQAYPALELTLTNDRDEPLARRVLRPADYLARASRDAAKEGLASCAGGVPSCEFQVKLVFNAESVKASGYRLYLFYPS